MGKWSLLPICFVLQFGTKRWGTAVDQDSSNYDVYYDVYDGHFLLKDEHQSQYANIWPSILI